METETEPSRTERKPLPHAFKPGNNANPRGRPPKSAQQRQLETITRKTLEAQLELRLGRALKVVDRTLKDPDNAVAFRAAVDLLDRVGGKAVQRVEASVTDTSPSRVVTVEELRLAAQRLLALQATDAQVRE